MREVFDKLKEEKFPEVTREMQQEFANDKTKRNSFVDKFSSELESKYGTFLSIKPLKYSLYMDANESFRKKGKKDEDLISVNSFKMTVKNTYFNISTEDQNNLEVYDNQKLAQAVLAISNANLMEIAIQPENIKEKGKNIRLLTGSMEYDAAEKQLNKFVSVFKASGLNETMLNIVFDNKYNQLAIEIDQGVLELTLAPNNKTVLDNIYDMASGKKPSNKLHTLTEPQAGVNFSKPPFRN